MADKSDNQRFRSVNMGMGVAIGLAIGAALSIAFENWAMLALGLAIGIAFAVILRVSATRRDDNRR